MGARRLPVHVFIVLALMVLVSLGPLGGLAQNDDLNQQGPLFRDDFRNGDAVSYIRVGGHKVLAQTILQNNANPVWISVGDVEVQNRYQCIRRGAEGSETGPLIDSNCELGKPVGGVSPATSTSRTAVVHYSLNNSVILTPTTGTTATIAQDPLVGSAHTATLNGTLAIPDTVDPGTRLRWLIPVELSGNTKKIPCGADNTADNICVDPGHTSGATFYVARLDPTVPKLVVVTDTEWTAAAANEREWYVYTDGSSNTAKKPSVHLGIIDDTRGAPLDATSVSIIRNGNQQQFVRVDNGTNTHSLAYQHSYSGLSHEVGTATPYDVVVSDTARNVLDSRVTGSNAALWVVIDTTPPQFVDGHIALPGGADGLFAPGTEVIVYANATDIAGEKTGGAHGSGQLATPPQIMDITVELVAKNDPTVRSDPYPLVWNGTCAKNKGCFHTDGLLLPTDWPLDGPVLANITVADPAGRSIQRDGEGEVSVDINAPTMTPLAPLDATKTSGFSRLAEVDFRLRIVDPGDTDTWKGSSHDNDDDTDYLGIDVDTVKVHFQVEGGNPGEIKLVPRAAENTYGGRRTFNAVDNISYFFTAEDFAGNKVRFPADKGENVTLLIDSTGPTVQPFGNLAFLGSDQTFRFYVNDTGVGVDPSAATLHWRVGTSGSFTEQQMTAIGSGNNIQVETKITSQVDGTRIQYFVEVADLLGSTGAFGTLSNPKSTLVDATPPTATISAPSTATSSNFTITWSGSDDAGSGAGSGVADYSVQFRLGESGQWFDLVKNTKDTSYSVCAVAQQTYNFRISARDVAGNVAPFPEDGAGIVSTFVDTTESCAQEAAVTVTSPVSGATVSGTTTVSWTAVSTTFPEDLRYRILLIAGGTTDTLVIGLEKPTFQWASNAPGRADVCVKDGTYTLRVVAVDPNGLEGSGEVPGIQLQNGITNCNDRDNDGLPDEWEFANFGNLGQGPTDDHDGDGFSNLAEFTAGTNPDSADEVPGDGTGQPGDGDDDTAFSWWYLLVPALFAAVIAVYVIGVQRRW